MNERYMVKVKLSLCLMPRYGDVIHSLSTTPWRHWEWRYSSTHSYPRRYMEMSGQPQAPATLLPGREPLVPTGEEAGWNPEPVWKLWRRGKFPALAGTRTTNHSARSPVICKTNWNVSLSICKLL